MMKWMNVKELPSLGLDEFKSIGMMRLDWLGSRKDEMCNQWFPDTLFDQAKGKFSHQQLQQELYHLMLDELGTFEHVLKHCQGEGYRYEEVFKVQGQEVNYFIRLVPVQTSYSYIFVYLK